MKLAILSDIHDNLHALQAVWEDLEASKPDAVYCLGDLVGYGAYPNETIAFIRERQVSTVMGNYDDGVGFDRDDCGCLYKDAVQARLGERSLRWTRKITTQTNKDYLKALPQQIRIEAGTPRLLLVHGSPRKINEYLYQDRPQASFERIARQVGTEIVLFGHTHLHYKKRVSGIWFINCGSVGKPKDGDTRAGYVMLRTGIKTRIEFRRVAYDSAAAARAIRESDLPDDYAEALETGGVEPTASHIAELGQ
ncbi:MAG TPA: metallophosphoesterase family protein [Anaerolineales bacterium]|nr:metallophosphoesterase family protein [Anaerolineales bacterium]